MSTRGTLAESVTDLATPVVQATGVGKRYGSTWALRRCCLRIDPGQVVALVGPNGAGKSTLLNLLTGLVDPSEGVVRVFGGAVTGGTRSRVAFTAQAHPLYRQLRVGDMLRAGRALNMRWDDRGARARLAELGIGVDRKVGQLSGGQQAQVSLTLALAKRPELLLLDEPVAALDPLARREFMQILMGAAAEEGLTIVLSSHVVAELERVCDHLIVLAGGQVQVAGEVDALLAEHVLVTGPRTAAAGLAREHTVISRSDNDAGTHSTMLVRRSAAPLDPRWTVQPIALEELVLTYLRHPDTSALSGPQPPRRPTAGDRR